jgi:hypothetical protein
MPPRPHVRRTLALLLALGTGARAVADDAPPALPVDVATGAPPDDAPPPAEAPPALPAAEATVDAPPATLQRSPYKWGGVVVPLVGFNTTDGVGFGLGGQIFLRKRELDFGYRDMLTLQTYWAVSGKYTSNYLQYERRGTHFVVARLSYRLWTDMIYTGSGGRDVATVLPEDVTRGNRLAGPSALITGQFHVDHVPFRVWAQAYARYTQVVPKVGGLLEQERPYGVDGGWYGDASVGLFVNEVDRWPLPNKGVVAQASVRGGFSTSAGQAWPVVGVNVEASGWLPLVGQRLVLGGRALFDKTWGHRPFYEKEWLGGTMRDEVALDQILVGYGRTRTRGDGVLAAIVDLRGWLGRTRHAFFDASFTLDVWAELGYAFDGGRPGPPLPSVGGGPGILWQGATLLRPWIGVGWLRDGADSPRTAQALFGLALVEPL